MKFVGGGRRDGLFIHEYVHFIDTYYDCLKNRKEWEKSIRT
jgi:hypothetical protein